MLNKSISKQEAITLTKRQSECAHWLIQGKTAAEIAIILGLSKRTVESYITTIKNKFECHKIAQLIYKLLIYQLPR